MKLFTILLISLLTFTLHGQEYHVSTTGDNNNSGSESLPWRSIQHAMEEATPGSTVLIHGGNYNEPLYLEVSGEEDKIISFQAFGEDEVIVDGSNFVSYAMLEIVNKHHISIIGIIFQNFQQNDAVGILIEGQSNDITIENCTLRNINFSSNPSDGVNENTNSQPIIIYGTEPSHPITNLNILNNQIYNCRTGYSEALAINGNVDGFNVARNKVFDISNIGIDIIGHEGTCSDPALDQARNGRISNNETFRCKSPYATSAGIYVDGGKNLIIENNFVHDNQWGIEVGCENEGKSTSDIVVRNNFIYNNETAGLHVGGYDYPFGSGKVQKTQIVNNTLFGNDQEEDYTGEIYLSYNEGLRIYNNIFHSTNTPGILLSTEDLPDQSTGVEIQYNNWFANEIEGFGFFYFNGVEYESVGQFENGVEIVQNNISRNSLFTSIEGTIDLHLTSLSPLIDIGLLGNELNYGSKDIDGQARIQQNGIDLGADEYELSSPVTEARIPVNNGIYPNPAIDFINFDYSLQELQIQRVKIMDVGGKVIYSGVFDQCINVTNFLPGMYHIQFISDHGIEMTSKFIKSR